MGYAYNHLATIVCGIFAGVLTILWPILVPAFPVLNFTFIMAVSITWFMVFVCWIAQKSTDYTHKPHVEKKHSSQAI